MEPTSKKTKSRPKLNPTESAALQRLEHDLITDSGTVPVTKGRHAIHCLTVIGTIEGHTLAPDAQKTTKYEHVIPQLVDIEEDPEIEGLLVILNTVGGDVEAGLALAELIAGVNKPSATPVSYTHLDVYKRQGFSLRFSANLTFYQPENPAADGRSCATDNTQQWKQTQRHRQSSGPSRRNPE